jgi:hypothetical protein
VSVMYMIKTVLSIAPLFCLSCVMQAAEPVSDHADIIVVGEVLSGQQSGSRVAFTLRVDRNLKGNIVPASVIQVEWDRAPVTRTPQQISGHYGMWFLHANANGTWQLLPATHSNAPLPLSLACYPILKGSAPSTSSVGAQSVNDLVAGELSTAVEHLSSGTTEFYYTATGLLSLSGTSAVTSQYQRLSQMPDPQLQVLGLIGLVRQGDAVSIERVLELQEALRTSKLSVHMVSAVRNVRDGTPRAAQALGSLATTSGVGSGLQMAASEALRSVHTKESLPFLVALLDSPNALIRHEGLAGISMFVENLPIQKPEMVPSMTWLTPQGPAPYRTADTDKYSAKFGEPPDRQAEYVAFWKSWWAKVRSQLKP